MPFSKEKHTSHQKIQIINHPLNGIFYVFASAAENKKRHLQKNFTIQNVGIYYSLIKKIRILNVDQTTESNKWNIIYHFSITLVQLCYGNFL